MTKGVTREDTTRETMGWEVGGQPCLSSSTLVCNEVLVIEDISAQGHFL